VNRDRRESALVGVLTAETDQAQAAYADRHKINPSGLACALREWVARDLDQRPTMPTDEAEALIQEAALLGLLIGVKIGAGRRT
jgi:hypothetical protein